MKVRIIEWLLKGHLGFDIERDSIGLEVLFSRNKRRAGMLIVSNEFHALEIKGDLDSLAKLPNQLHDYSNTFDKTSLVITTKHLKNIRQLLPRYTGIIIHYPKSAAKYHSLHYYIGNLTLLISPFDGGLFLISHIFLQTDVSKEPLCSA